MNDRLERRVVTLLGTSAMAALLAMTSVATAAAQEAQASAGSSDGASADVIVVTGSRIARPDIDANVPIVAVGEEAIQESGAVNIQDVLQELPQVGIGNSRTNTNFSTTGNGVATINLRNLGTQRTLVLVNGRRVIGGFAGTSTVDINNIPTDFVERIDVVTGGASAVYGSEAIAGVVNFVLKDEFEGIQARAQYGITDEGDNPRYLVSLTGGTTWGADDRGNVIVNFSYDKDEGLLSRKRKISSQDCFGAVCGPEAYSSYPDQGLFFYGAGDDDLFTFDRNNNVVPGFPTGFGYNRNNDRRIAVPVERYLTSAVVNYDLSDNVEAYVEATYAKTKAGSRLEPLALDSGDIGSDGYSIDNPFIPASIQALIATRNSDADPDNDVTNISFFRRQNDVFDRSNANDRDTWRIAAGLRGELGGAWNYDVSYVFGRLKDHTETQDVDAVKYRNALDAIRDPATGNIVCRSADARAAGCVPINLFGRNRVSPEAAAYVQAALPRSDDITNTQHVVSASLSGTLLTLPAGDLGIAFGAEYRKEKSFDDWDTLTNLGQNSGNQTPDTRGSFDVKEVYGEVNVPLLADKPFANYLGLTGAARYSDYSTVGGVFSWNAGIEYAPVDGLRLRSVYAVANRAPNIGELYTPPSETFPTGFRDPCEGVMATSSGQFDAACRAIPGIAALIAANGSVTYRNLDYQTINGFNGGNPNLKEETAKTLTIGAVLAPSALRGFSMSVDYFNIKVDDAINSVPLQTSIDQCLLTGEESYCQNVIRFADSGRLQTVNANQINASSFKTSGIDVNLRYNTPLGLAEDDRLSLSLLYTYLIDLEQTPFAGAETLNEVGQLSATGRLGAGFEHKASMRAAYSFGGFTASWQVNYLSKIKDTLDFDADGDEELEDLNSVSDAFYHDVQLRYAVGEDRNYEFYFGVDNLFDNKPPLLPQGFASSITGTETAADTYDPFGRRFYVGATVRF